MRPHLLPAVACVILSGFATAQVSSEGPKVWAIVVGIDAYDDPTIPSCRGASGDARAIRRWLVETAGWDGSQVLGMDASGPLHHGPKEQQIAALRPTRANLNWAVKEWLSYRVRPGDVVLIAFAGQAIGGLSSDPDSPDVLLPIDALASDPQATGWALPEAIDALASRGENPLLVWLDTSLKGRGRAVGKLVGRRTEGSRLLMETTRWPGVSAWIAADPEPLVEPANPRVRGAFVETILGAMGTAEKPGNLLGAIFAANRDPRLAAQGFRTAGGLGPEWSLWPRSLASLVRPPSEMLLQRGHADRITSLAFSADGATMISASMDSTIKVWRTEDRVLLRTLPAHTIGVTALALGPDGSKAASGDGQGRVILWDLIGLRPSRFLGPSPHDRGIAKLTYLADGSGFASLDLGGRAVAWTVEEGRITPRKLAEGTTAIAAGRDIFAVAGGDVETPGAIRLFRRDGPFLRSLSGPGGFVAPDALAIRGDRIAAGDRSGAFGIWNLADGDVRTRTQANEPIDIVGLTDRVAVAASGTSALVLWSDRAIPPASLELGGRAGRVVLTEDGKLVAAATTSGAISAFDLSDPKVIARVDLEAGAGAAPSTVLAISPRGRMVSGDQDGGIRFWEWPGGKAVGRIAPHRGKIDTLAVSPDGRHLTQIDHDRGARIWDLRDGRDFLTIRGRWASVAFLPDNQTLAMTDHDGAVRLVDLATTKIKDAAFDPPGRDGGNAATAWGFESLATSPDGKRIAGGSPQGPVACVWPAGGGAPSLTIRDHEDAISVVGFADDSKHLLTASRDGVTKIRAIEADGPLWELIVEAGDSEDADPAVTAAKIAPGTFTRVVTGHRDGRLLAWELGADRRPKPIEIGRFEGAVHGVAFTPDASRLIACGADKTVRLWRFDGPLPPGPPARFAPQHDEQVNALVAWPNGQLLATAGDDATIRFWKPDGPKLLGTLAGDPQSGRWVAYTPDGRFDSAPGGEARVTYVQADRIFTLDQVGDDGRVFGLGAMWLDGKTPEGRSGLMVSRPPPLWLAPPSPANENEVDLTVRLAEPGMENLRIYLNDEPVRDDDDFRPTADPNRKMVRVRLAPGENQLVAMASRPGPGAIFGRSNVIRLDGPTPDSVPSGVVHSLALGISKYDRNSLQFADRDATDLAEFLANHGVGEGKRSGLKLVLRNDQVTPRAVEDALQAMRRQARPEDTVVVFLAGHTDVRRDRFLLLLEKFPFASDAVRPGERGPIEPRDALAPSRDDPSTILPYDVIYRTLARMDALNRLVVIDACQAEAVFDDPGVRRIQDKVDDGAHRARTSYLLAARRGEAANESVALHHGLFTHLLLKGMGSGDLAREPGGDLGHADLDGDGLVTTEELRQFVATNLPILGARVALAGRRNNPDANPPRPDPARAQAATTVFPLVRIPR